jgi:uncharacterized protein involved in exopolysaccharide biosynthesis
MRNDESTIPATTPPLLHGYTRQKSPTRRDVAAVLFRQRWPILIAFGLVVIAVALSGVWVPQYTAEMKILVLRQRSDTMLTPSANAPIQYNDDQVSAEDLNSEVELLNSDDLLRKVVLTTGLDGARDSSSIGGNDVRTARAEHKLSGNLDIRGISKSNMISVRYRASSPEMAHKVLEALAAAYMQKHLEMHRRSGEFKFFDELTEQYQQGLNQAQEKLTDFNKETGIVSAEIERDAALHQAGDFDAAARQAETAEIGTEQRVTALHAELNSIKPRITTVVRKSDNPELLDQLKSTLLNLELKRTELLTKYEPTYRLVQEVDRQIADAKSTISAEEEKPVRDETSDRNPDYQWVQAELTKAEADLSDLKGRASAASAVAAKYHAQARRLDQSMATQQNLVQAARTQQENYLLYEHKREDARISDALDRGGFLNVAVAEQPAVPAIPERSPLTVALITLLLAGAFSLSTAFVRDYMDPTFRTPGELVADLGTPVLAAFSKGR